MLAPWSCLPISFPEDNSWCFSLASLQARCGDKYRSGNRVVILPWHCARAKNSHQQAGHAVPTQLYSSQPEAGHLQSFLRMAATGLYLSAPVHADTSFTASFFFCLFWIYIYVYIFVCQSLMAGYIWIAPSVDVNCLYNNPAALLGKQSMQN